MYTQKMHEVQKHATISNHGYLGYAVIVNKAFWDGLDPAVREKLSQAMAEATVYSNSIAKRENEAALAAMKAAGKTEFHELTDDERAEWVEALRPVYDQMAGRVGVDLIEQVRTVLGTTN
jgi:C4-dicarboxylate-binding protein DctP